MTAGVTILIELVGGDVRLSIEIYEKMVGWLQVKGKREHGWEFGFSLVLLSTSIPMHGKPSHWAFQGYRYTDVFAA
jgi:hypothetical protein